MTFFNLAAHPSARSIRRAIALLPVGILVVALIMALCIGQLDVRHAKREMRADVRLRLAAIGAQAQSHVRSAFSESEGLAQLIAVDGDISAPRFSGMVRQLTATIPYLSHIVLAPGDVVRDVYPREDNEGLIGVDLSTLSTQVALLERSRQERRSVLAGPLRLHQGGTGLIFRRPVFTSGHLGQAQYWGTLSIVAGVKGLLDATGITDQAGLEIALRGCDGRGGEGAMIWGDPALFDAHNVVADIDVPGGQWQLAARPVGGWPTIGLMNSQLFELCLIGGLLLALFCALLARGQLLLTRRNNDLKHEVAERQQAEAELARIAHYDSVTQLPNRVLFRHHLDQHVQDTTPGYRFSVLLLDIDGFKVINDTLGHVMGDLLLQQAAQRLEQHILPGDSLARLGGDEFGFIFLHAEGATPAAVRVEHLVQAMQQPFDLQGNAALVSASIGVALYPTDGSCAADLLRHADTAMYSAKEAGRNGLCFYQPAMTSAIRARVVLEHALRRALHNEEFEVWYQPKVHLRTGVVTGAEALLRWRDPTQGMVYPDVFIPIAERTGLIIPIGQWVVNEVCRQQQAWRQRGVFDGRVAINVAAPQIDRSDLVACVLAALAQYQLPAAALEVEVTESLLMESPERAREALARLQAEGVSTAIDDFGTGHSSLAYLKLLPVNHLKIDRAFVRDLPHDLTYGAITEAIISLGQALAFDITAEGVETAEQCTFLQQAGCAYGQGYYFGRPMPASAFEGWLAKRAVGHASVASQALQHP
ncbi:MULTISPECIES: putative bifunctional diguanylate cyclase/phosphodiesterase [Pseudomonas]|uniref:EAL domain-containing protein n=1 Tax=Pseudomonas quercus TaxID=2722792 RepID=A0ABX0YF15_9PSED|nr:MULTISPECIES: EAL domain-containing protein [Pseudomonas]MBF7143910.1 EAL domain-containing protein [Pseudomonas sp. LY10J]NJP02011.1 EAL domain-containing protein [Pseudomonas quercus]